MTQLLQFLNHPSKAEILSLRDLKGQQIPTLTSIHLIHTTTTETPSRHKTLSENLLTGKTTITPHQPLSLLQIRIEVPPLHNRPTLPLEIYQIFQSLQAVCLSNEGCKPLDHLHPHGEVRRHTILRLHTFLQLRKNQKLVVRWVLLPREDQVMLFHQVYQNSISKRAKVILPLTKKMLESRHLQELCNLLAL